MFFIKREDSPLQSDLGIDHPEMPMCSVVSCVAGKRVFAVTGVLAWQNTVSHCPASFCSPRPNLPVTPGIS